MTKLRILFRTGDSIEFPVKDKAAATSLVANSKYDNTVQHAIVDGQKVASWLGAECVAMVVQESGGK